MTEPDYPAIADLLSGMFHQDFDVVGDSVAEVMSAFRDVTPREELLALRAEVVRFLNSHDGDLDEAFERIFRPDVIPSAFSGSARAFLEEIQASLE